MPQISEQKKKQIIEALRKCGVNQYCPRCGNASFTLADGYFNQPVQGELTSLVVGGPSIPSVVTICDKCGFVAQHALGVLGLLNKEASDEAE